MNRKIKNATPLEYDGIKFKSKLEVTTYKTFKENNFEVLYEPTKYIIWKGFKPTENIHYTRNKKTGELVSDHKKLIDITYTPDFGFKYNAYNIIIECKGAWNEVFPYKRKLFKAYIENWNKENPDNKILYFEVYSKRNVLQAIEIIKSYDSVRQN